MSGYVEDLLVNLLDKSDEQWLNISWKLELPVFTLGTFRFRKLLGVA